MLFWDEVKLVNIFNILHNNNILKPLAIWEGEVSAGQLLGYIPLLLHLSIQHYNIVTIDEQRQLFILLAFISQHNLRFRSILTQPHSQFSIRKIDWEIKNENIATLWFNLLLIKGIFYSNVLWKIKLSHIQHFTKPICYLCKANKNPDTFSS